MNLQKFKAKVCFTASGVLIYQQKVLLIKHKKLGIWLVPGGHVEGDELPHQAAEREFWEEAGIKVQAVAGAVTTQVSECLPNPILSDLHWVCRENYDARLKNPKNYTKAAVWQKGCEQHVCFIYLVQPVDGINFKQNTEETDGIGWFSLEEIKDLDTTADIKNELAYAFTEATKLESK